MFIPILAASAVLFLAFVVAQSGRGAYRNGVCQVCRREAQLNAVTFRYNIGMLVARRYATLQGSLCKSCIHATYWKYAAINVSVGWLGYISLFVAPSFLLINTYVYLRSLGMTPPGLAAQQTGFDPSPPPIG